MLGWEEHGVAIQILYCRLVELVERQKGITIQYCIVTGMAAGGQILSQYKNCIVRKSGKRQGCLCRKTGSCVTTRRWARQQARAQAGAGELGGLGAGRVGGALGARADARQGEQAAGARAAGTRAAGERGPHSRGAAGARPRGWASGLGARAGLGLCTRCTRPIFRSVLTRYSS